MIMVWGVFFGGIHLKAYSLIVAKITIAIVMIDA